MCGRYALALRPSEIRQILESADMPVSNAPEDSGAEAPRQSYNFAPGYFGAIYRAETPDHGAGPRQDTVRANEAGGSTVLDGRHVEYKLQSMKWGLVPSWSKRGPDYASILKTINCRSDSLLNSGGMWASMKARKRCIVIAQGFFEWLKTGPKDKLPHYIKRRDGQLMCFAGLWDCVQYHESEPKLYTYTIITTDSNKQLNFLHDRMPVIMDPGSDAIKTWLDPGRHQWSRELQGLLQPFHGPLDVYPVTKEVGKVGNNSPTFIRPLDSAENKSNIANFFTKSHQAPEKGLGNADSEHDALPTGGKLGKRKQIDNECERSPKRNATEKPKMSASKNIKGESPERLKASASKITNFFPSV